MQPEIMEYYQRGGEVTRLTAGDGRLEFLRTWDVLERVLPPAPAAVLDVGGATGVYARPLAAAGYRVHVVDPVPEHVSHAGEIPGVTAELGDARQLTQAGASYDAVLLLGPLYHLVGRDDRVTAWREAARVVKPGGVVVAATITRFASLHDGFLKKVDTHPRFTELVRADLATGHHRVPEGTEKWFTTAYFHHPDEVPAEVRNGGLTLERLVTVESVLWLVAHLDEILDDAGRTARLLDLFREIEEEPSLLGAGSHLLAVARRPV
jgi:2-polyprenyl-3-methyl-5-hydroxy-6-metoxy-1,4-benzoquinol methylase